jgi:type I restriction enzyme, S subunit
MTETKKIPEGWEEVKLESVTEILDSKRVPITKSERKKGNTPYYGATGLLDYVEGFIFDEELVLIGEDGADWSSYANTAYIIKGKSWVNNHAHALRCTKINSIFFKEFINKSDLKIYITGTTRGKLNQESLRKIKLLCPPLKEQEKIASILSKVDDQIQTTEEIITKSEELKKGLMQDIFNNEKQKQWNTSKIKDVVIKLKRGHSLATNSIGKGVIYMTSGFLQDNYIDWSIQKYLDTDKPLDNCLLVKGDVILNCVNSWAKLGKVAVFEGYKKPVVVGFNNFGITFNNKINPFFVKYFLLTKRIQYLLRAVSKPAVQQVSFSGSDLLRLEIKYPSIEEQNKIIIVLMGVDNNIQDNKAEVDRLQELKKGLMQDLLTGKVRVAM